MCLFNFISFALINIVLLSSHMRASLSEATPETPPAAAASASSAATPLETPSAPRATPAPIRYDCAMLRSLPRPDNHDEILAKHGVTIPDKSSDTPPLAHSAECYVWLFDRGALRPPLLEVFTKYAGNSRKKSAADSAVMHTLIMGKAPEGYDDTCELIPRVLALRDLFYVEYPHYFCDGFCQAVLTPAQPSMVSLKHKGFTEECPGYQSRVALYAAAKSFPLGTSPEGIFAGHISFIPRQIPNPSSAIMQPAPPSDTVESVLHRFSHIFSGSLPCGLSRVSFHPLLHAHDVTP